MRSRLEATWARTFDRMGIAWKYEPDCFADEFATYLPDFLIAGRIFVEIKPPMNEGELVYARRRMEVIWRTVDAPLWLIHLQHADVGGFCVDHTSGDGQPWVRDLGLPGMQMAA
jgi:hypothetical protein